MLSIIVAYDEERGIGKNNKLPWHYPADLRYFKETTQGHTIAMGRKTFLSIGRALPGRKNIVFTTDARSLADVADIEVNTNPLAFFEQEEKTSEEIFVIGGSAIFEIALPYVQRLYITKIPGSFNADTYFPAIDMTKYVETSAKTEGELTFAVYERKNM